MNPAENQYQYIQSAHHLVKTVYSYWSHLIPLDELLTSHHASRHRDMFELYNMNTWLGVSHSVTCVYVNVLGRKCHSSRTRTLYYTSDRPMIMFSVWKRRGNSLVTEILSNLQHLLQSPKSCKQIIEDLKLWEMLLFQFYTSQNIWAAEATICLG